MLQILLQIHDTIPKNCTIQWQCNLNCFGTILLRLTSFLKFCLSYCDADIYICMYLCWRVRFLWSRLLKQVLMNIINIIRSIVIHTKIMIVAPFIMPIRHDLKASLWKIVWNCQSIYKAASVFVFLAS